MLPKLGRHCASNTSCWLLAGRAYKLSESPRSSRRHLQLSKPARGTRTHTHTISQPGKLSRSQQTQTPANCVANLLSMPSFFPIIWAWPARTSPHLANKPLQTGIPSSSNLKLPTPLPRTPHRPRRSAQALLARLRNQELRPTCRSKLGVPTTVFLLVCLVEEKGQATVGYF